MALKYSLKVSAGMNWGSRDGLVVVRHEQQVAGPALEGVLLIRPGGLADDDHAVTAIGASRIFGHRELRKLSRPTGIKSGSAG